MNQENLVEVGREYRGTLTTYCRSCREVEIFDRYLVTFKHEITNEREAWTVRVCQGCGYESEG
jgi:hypothetical protein